jgi:hypothetical protein
MVKRIVVAFVAIFGLCAGIAPSANAEPTVPLIGYQVDYSVTATVNGVQTNSASTFTFTNDNVVSNAWFDIAATPWSRATYTRANPRGLLSINAKPTNPNPVYGVITYRCTISVNGVVVSSKKNIGKVTCAY